MDNYLLVTDATCDLDIETVEKYNIEVLPMSARLGDKEYMHYYDFREISFEDFYEAIRQGQLSSTSQITPHQYIEHLSPMLEAGNDILYICFTSGLSNSYQSSLLAQKELQEKFPERKLVIIDSLNACTGEGYTVYHAALNKEKGMGLEENAKWIEDNRQNLASWFTVEDLKYLYRGGRVSRTTAIVGGALNIKPILHVDSEGKLNNVNTAHGRNKSLRALADKLKETAINPAEQTIYISHGDCLKDAEKLRDIIMKQTPVKKVVFSRIGPVVGTHTGPGAITLHFYAKGR